SLLNPTYRGIDTMKRISVLVFGLILLVWAAPSAIAADVEPPEGFHALFNGEDLAGWHGMPHFDPQKLEAMSEEERQKQLGQWWKETIAHWKVENGELVNDGQGPYLTT